MLIYYEAKTLLYGLKIMLISSNKDRYFWSSFFFILSFCYTRKLNYHSQFISYHLSVAGSLQTQVKYRYYCF
jgi:hypothetical protein